MLLLILVLVFLESNKEWEINPKKIKFIVGSTNPKVRIILNFLSPAMDKPLRCLKFSNKTKH